MKWETGYREKIPAFLSYTLKLSDFDPSFWHLPACEKTVLAFRAPSGSLQRSEPEAYTVFNFTYKNLPIPKNASHQMLEHGYHEASCTFEILAVPSQRRNVIRAHLCNSFETINTLIAKHSLGNTQYLYVECRYSVLENTLDIAHRRR